LNWCIDLNEKEKHKLTVGGQYDRLYIKIIQNIDIIEAYEAIEASF